MVWQFDAWSCVDVEQCDVKHMIRTSQQRAGYWYNPHDASVSQGICMMTRGSQDDGEATPATCG